MVEPAPFTLPRLATLLAAAALLGVAGCGDSGEDGAQAAPFASTYQPLPSSGVLLKDARILTGTGEVIEKGSVYLAEGIVQGVGEKIRPPRGTTVIDATGKTITPGIIDVHSHLGVYASPSVNAHSDGNEMTGAVTAAVWAEHAVWPQDPGFAKALAGGITSMQVLPGSANLIGGRTVTLKNVAARTMQGMKFPGAPHGLKMACGENPKRVYGQGRNSPPMTRMGNVAGYRSAWIRAQDYQRKLDGAAEGGEPPTRDLELETLAGVLRGEILVHNHCYRADEMAVMLDIAREFGYTVTAFHHAIESYKIADLLAEAGTCSAMWADWWGFKMEAFDTVRENIPLVEKAGACAIVHSDSGIGIQRLNQEAAKAMAAGRRAGIDFGPETAITWITRNAARALGIDEQTGTLEPGKMADVVLWDGDPFSVYTRAEKVFVDGALVYDRLDERYQPVSDFELGNLAEQGGVR